MSLGISIKEDEKKEKDNHKDISLWPREVLEKRYTSQKKISKYITIGFIIIAAMLVWQIKTNLDTQNELYNTQDELYNTQDALNTCVSDTLKMCPETNGTSGAYCNPMTEPVLLFFKWAVNINEPWFYKIMILLGILYLVQIIFAVAMDIVEVVLLIFVAIKRLVVWLYRLIKSEKKE
jgi:hypothetical protein